MITMTFEYKGIPDNAEMDELAATYDCWLNKGYEPDSPCAKCNCLHAATYDYETLTKYFDSETIDEMVSHLGIVVTK